LGFAILEIRIGNIRALSPTPASTSIL